MSPSINRQILRQENLNLTKMSNKSRYCFGAMKRCSLGLLHWMLLWPVEKGLALRCWWVQSCHGVILKNVAFFFQVDNCFKEVNVLLVTFNMEHKSLFVINFRHIYNMEEKSSTQRECFLYIYLPIVRTAQILNLIF